MSDGAVSDMVAMLQCDARTARYYLSLCGGVQQAAVGLYFERGAEPPPASFENDAGSKPKYSVPDAEGLPTIAKAEQDALETFAKELKVPSSDASIFKDECMFGFDTPESEHGLFLNLRTLYSVGREWLEMDAAKTGAKFYLHQKWVKVPKESADSATETTADGADGAESGSGTESSSGKPTTVTEHLQQLLNEGDKFETQKTVTIYSQASKMFLTYPFAGISEHLYNVVETILAAKDDVKAEAVAVLEEEKTESKYAKDLVQEPNVTVNPDPKSWVCKEDGLRENLWLNLSDGHIGSGRQYFDGSGGKNGALNHYKELLKQGKNYPLVVKLGTITKDGADVYSYASDEDKAVLDPYLATHLANIGINIMQCEKTEKTVAEQEYELNMNKDWSAVFDENGKSVPVASGPGAVGLENLGNSCYMNSVLQALFTIPEVREDFANDNAKRIFSTCTTEHPNQEFDVNMAKVGHAMFRPDAISPIRPQAFKNFIGKGHSLFSTGQQQDAAEFLAHLLTVVGRAHVKASARADSKTNKPFRNFADLFSFHVERRICCNQSGKVRYLIEDEQSVGMQVPMDNARVKPQEDKSSTNGAAAKKIKLDSDPPPDVAGGAPDNAPLEGEDKPAADPSEAASAAPEETVAPATTSSSSSQTVYEVDFSDCLSAMMAPSITEDWTSPVTGKKGTCTRGWGFKTLPCYLLWKVNRFYVDEKWTPQKRNVEVNMPEELDVAALMSHGLQPGEEEFSDAPEAGTVELVPDEASIKAITDMGFSRNAGIRACKATSNGGTDACVNWVMMHMEDADLNDPVTVASSGASKGAAEPPEQSVQLLVSMGLPRHHCVRALQSCSNDVERAAEWAFSHPVESEPTESSDGAKTADERSEPSVPQASEADSSLSGPVSTKYKLVAIVTHLGRNSNSGHYVCHLRSEATGGKWLHFNDAKVSEVPSLPLGIGYLYIYEQVA